MEYKSSSYFATWEISVCSCIFVFLRVRTKDYNLICPRKVNSQNKTNFVSCTRCCYLEFTMCVSIIKKGQPNLVNPNHQTDK